MGARWAWKAECLQCRHCYSGFSGGADDCPKCGSADVRETSDAVVSPTPRDNFICAGCGEEQWGQIRWIDGASHCKKCFYLKGYSGVPKETRYTDPKTGGQKGMKLARYGLIPIHALEQIANVYGYGAGKYAPNNWRKGYPWSLSIDALDRHVAEFRKGNSIDSESGLHHLAHAAFHLLTLMEFERGNLGTNDMEGRDGAD